MNTPAPSFLNSKAQRGKADREDVQHILSRYADIFAGLITFDGDLPERMPEGFIMSALFWDGGVQFRNIKGLGFSVVPVKSSELDIYGQPVRAIPVIEHMAPGVAGIDLFTPSDAPCLWLGESIADKLRPYARIMGDAIKSLRQNLIALRQPVVIQGTQGGEVGALLLGDEIEEGESMVYRINGAGGQVSVMSLGGEDHTQNLIGVINAMDSQCLSLMGVKGSGADKASGISATETEYVAQQCGMLVYQLYERISQWLEKVNSYFGVNITCAVGEGWTPAQSDNPEPTDKETEENGQ